MQILIAQGRSISTFSFRGKRGARTAACAGPRRVGAVQLGGLPDLKTRDRGRSQPCQDARGSLPHDRRTARANCCGPKSTIRVHAGPFAIAYMSKSDQLPRRPGGGPGLSATQRGLRGWRGRESAGVPCPSGARGAAVGCGACMPEAPVPVIAWQWQAFPTLRLWRRQWWM